MSDRQRCVATKKDGSPCLSWRELSAEGLCLFHDESRADELKQRQSRGGIAATGKRVRKPTTPVETLEAVITARSWILQELFAGRMTKDEAGTLRAVLSDQERTITSDLGKRIKELEATIKKLGTVTK